MVIAVMFAVYDFNLQLDKAAYLTEVSTETNNKGGDIQSDSDAHEDESSNRVSQYICVTENLSIPFNIKNPSFLNFHFYSVWQPPQNC
jgi:hypothetical protein